MDKSLFIPLVSDTCEVKSVKLLNIQEKPTFIERHIEDYNAFLPRYKL